jgi:dTDP-4-dehydrorhamnose 3,5-epimerase
MKVTPLAIAGAWLIESPVFPDERGMFREWFKAEALKENGIPEFEVRQANTSISHEGVIRGIHFSDELVGQSKIVTCSSGSILDVIVDLRPGSESFCQFVSLKLSANEGKAIYISKGLGHALQAFEDNSTITYLLDKEYDPKMEFAINPLDPDLDISWPNQNPNISEKDRSAKTIKEYFESRGSID